MESIEANRYLIHTGLVSTDGMVHQKHVMDKTRQRHQLFMGNDLNLTKTGIHLCRLSSGNTSSTLHWHSFDDEWFYILEASPEAVLLLLEGNSTREVKVTEGDFFGFPAGTPIAHGFRCDSGELVYLVGGSRVEVDVCHYPELKKRRVKVTNRDAYGPSWVAEEANIENDPHTASSLSPNHPPNFQIKTGGLSTASMANRSHPVNPSRGRYQLSLGDEVGLSKVGIHFCRLPAGKTSTVLHWHSHDDEWFYILEAASDAVVKLRQEGGAETREEQIVKGDFLGFPAGVKTAHALSSGEGELVYLIGGCREPLDICSYTEVGKRRVCFQGSHRIEDDWIVEETHITAI